MGQSNSISATADSFKNRKRDKTLNRTDDKLKYDAVVVDSHSQHLLQMLHLTILHEIMDKAIFKV